MSGRGGCGQLLLPLLDFSQNRRREALALLVINALHDFLAGRRHVARQLLRSFAVAVQQQLDCIVRLPSILRREKILRLVIDHDQRPVLVWRKVLRSAVRPHGFAGGEEAQHMRQVVVRAHGRNPRYGLAEYRGSLAASKASPPEKLIASTPTFGVCDCCAKLLAAVPIRSADSASTRKSAMPGTCGVITKKPLAASDRAKLTSRGSLIPNSCMP